MEIRHYLTCLWPGLPELWWQGRLSALPVAAAFGIALNLLLVTRYIYPQWISGILVSMAFWVSICVWGFYVFHRIRDLPAMLQPRVASDAPDLFPEARNAYLRSDWHEAETMAMRVLAIEPRDPPTLLLLCGIYRHTERPDNAKSLMKELTRLEVADYWHLEITGEQRRIDRDLAIADEDEEPATIKMPVADSTREANRAA